MKLVILVVAAIAYVHATCAGNTCATCVETAGCGWCGATQQCLEGGNSGPTTGGQCLATWQIGTCSPCSQYSASCRECLAIENCAWNDVENVCAPLGTGDAERKCPCTDFPTCSTCIYESPQSACQWCEVSGECGSTLSTCAGGIIAHTCDCSSFYGCSACLANDGCDWCNHEGLSSCVNSGSCAGTPLTCMGYCNLNNGNCDGCLASPGCTYCSEGTCTDTLEKAADCMMVHTCPSTCPKNDDCSKCIVAPGCLWCSSSSSCISSSESLACPQLTGDCSGSKGGFSAGSFVGGMFLSLGIVGLGAAVFFWYRRRQAQGVYESVN